MIKDPAICAVFRGYYFKLSYHSEIKMKKYDYYGKYD